MNATFKHFSGRLMEGTRFSSLGTAFGRFLCVVGVFTLASQLSTSFFNVFLLRATGSSMAMMRYNLLLACIQPPAMLAAVQVVRRFSLTACLRTGLMMHVLAYVILTVDGGSSESLVYGISVLFSIGNGFYFTSYTPLLLSCTTDQNRDTAQGAMGSLSITGQLLLPLLTGMFIMSFGNLTGYRILFALSALLLLLGVFFSFRLFPVPAPKKTPHSIRRAARLMLENREMRITAAVTWLNATMTSGAAYYVSLLVYAILQKESVMGALSTLCGVISLLASLVYSRFVSSKNRGRSMLLGVGVSVLAALILVFFPTVWGYAIYALLYAAANLFLNNPPATAYFAVLQKDSRLDDYRAEVHALREFSVTGGRALALIPAFFLKDAVGTAAPVLLILILLQIPAALLVRSLDSGRADRRARAR